MLDVKEAAPLELEQELNQVAFKRAMKRRTFLERIGIASIGVAGVTLLNGCLSSQSVAADVSQADVLNFALNLEYLEAEFYSVAVTGSTLSPADTGSATGATTGGNQVMFSDSRVRDIATEIAADELAHVRFLRKALGSAAVSKPAINLGALGIGFANTSEFLILARAFEDTGVSAYGGAATLLNGNYLQAAAQILATEAYHAGNIRLQGVLNGLTMPMLDKKDQPPTENNFFPTDNNGLAVIRTPSEVLAIVYATATSGAAGGGFYPQGMNGTIKTV